MSPEERKTYFVLEVSFIEDFLELNISVCESEELIS